MNRRLPLASPATARDMYGRVSPALSPPLTSAPGSSVSASPAEDSLASGPTLTLRYRRVFSQTEIISVGISPGSPSSAFAVYAAPQTGQSWIDFFDLASQRSLTKIAGSHAVLGHDSGGGGGRVAMLRACTVRLGHGAEHHHASAVFVRDLATGKTAAELTHATREPVAWSLDGSAIAAGQSRDRLGVWDARSGTSIGSVVGHVDAITHAVFAPDRSLVTLSRDGTVRITDPATSRTLSRLDVAVDGGPKPRALGISADGRAVVSLWGSVVHLWCPHTRQLDSYDLRTTRRTEGWPLCFSPDCRWLACRTEDGFDLVDAASGRVVWVRHEGKGRGGSAAASMVTAAAFSPDATALLLGRMNGVVEVWDVEGSKEA